MNILLLVLVLLLLAGYFPLLAAMRNRGSQIDKSKKLAEIGKKIASNIKIKKLIREIISIVKEETSAEACTLYLIDEEKQELWFEETLGGKGDQVKQIRLRIGEGISGWVAREGVTLNIKDVNTDPRFNSRVNKSIDFKQKAMLTMPVKYKDKTIGVLQVINKIGAPCFTAQDEELLDSMGSQIAIAIKNAELYKELRDLLIDAISSLASAVDAKDPYTNGHSKRVTQYSIQTARKMGFDEERLELLEYMALLHDVGKIGIADSVLNKTERLTDDEFVIMKSHTIVGERILSSMKSLKNIVPGVKYHHEKYDGTGYYEGLKGEEIPFEARIISVADTYDAMTTDRPYRKGLEHGKAISEINRCSGTQFDPEVVKHFISIFE
ncbi:MAG TPA: HD domain-containing phosphohydrolase [Clostridia bacterium]|nr:HD domain-containing phosphohydrolase [Clostridia bacterium]